jgi:hypothetical protein
MGTSFGVLNLLPGWEPIYLQLLRPGRFVDASILKVGIPTCPVFGRIRWLAFNCGRVTEKQELTAFLFRLIGACV